MVIYSNLCVADGNKLSIQFNSLMNMLRVKYVLSTTILKYGVFQ